MRNIKAKFPVMVVFALVCSLLLVTTSFAGDYDFGGRTVTYYSPHNMANGFKSNFKDFGRWQDLDYAVSEINKKFNVNLVFAPAPTNDVINILATTVLSGEGDALFNMINWQGEIAALEGLLHPLDEFINDEYYSKLHPLLAAPMGDQKQSMVNGKTYFFWTIPSAAFAQGAPGVVWNKDLFDREGFPNLYELYETKEWTWDVFKEIALEATKDTDGDGVIDQWGVVTQVGPPSNPNFWVYLWHWALANGAEMIAEVDGKQKFAFTDERAYQAFDFWRELHEAKVVTNDVIGQFMRGEAAMSVGGVWISDHYQNMDEDWGFVPLPLGPQATEYVAYTDQFWTMAIPATASDAEALVALSNALHLTTSDYRDMDKWFTDLKNLWMLRFCDTTTWDVMEWMFYNAKPLSYRGILASIPEFTSAMGQAIVGNENPAVAMERVAPIVQARIDEVFGQ